MEEVNNKPIGVFDSGIGGLTVLKQLRELCPYEDYLYFADYANLPYGEKTKEELIFFIQKIFDFFEERQVKAVVMACNTSSAQVYEELKDMYSFKLYPIIQVASKCIAKDNTKKKIAVLATRSTVSSGMYSKSLKRHNQEIETLEIACPEWVSIVENKVTDFDEEAVILKYLKPVLEFSPDSIILGCTHYPYLLKNLAKYAPQDKFINPALTFSKYIKEDLVKNDSETKGSVKFYVSADAQAFKKNSSVFMQVEGNVEEVKL